jgi:hypothetical protein
MSIVSELLARGWAFDEEGVLVPPQPSPGLEATDHVAGVRYFPPGGEEIDGWVYYRDVNGQIIDAIWGGR